MSSDLLREAAAKMRERAEAAQPATDGDAWIIDYADPYADNREVYSGPLSAQSHDVASATDDETAEHIASWHPAVAVAVADWLDTQAARWDQVYADTQRPSAGVDQPPAIHYGDTFGAANTANHHTRHALAVARAYMNEEMPNV